MFCGTNKKDGSPSSIWSHEITAAPGIRKSTMVNRCAVTMPRSGKSETEVCGWMWVIWSPVWNCLKTQTRPSVDLKYYSESLSKDEIPQNDITSLIHIQFCVIATLCAVVHADVLYPNGTSNFRVITQTFSLAPQQKTGFPDWIL